MRRHLISEEKIDEIRQSINLPELVMEYMTLKKTGKNFVGKCPFHSEKTPSFTVSPEKQIFYCFGCGAGGNVFTFIMKQEGLAFPEAVRFLAKKAGVSLPEPELTVYQKKAAEEKENLREINEIATRFFHETLLSHTGGEAWSYLKKRGINKETVLAFQLGFAPFSGERLTALLEKRFSPDLLEKSGLFSKSKRNNSLYLKFKNRIMFPIWDGRGRVIGFGGRVMGTEEPKYLNSPETPLFKKNAILYGLHLAAEEIRKQGKVLIVEGYLDAITAFQFGYKNTVASLGTSLTDKQADLLRIRADEVIIAFDADAAGQLATLRGMKIFREQGLEVKVVTFPPDSDPDTFLRQKGREGFNQVLSGALHFMDYLLEAKKADLDLQIRAERIKYWQRVKPRLLEIEDLVEREDYLKKVARELKISLDTARKELEKKTTPPRRGHLRREQPEHAGVRVHQLTAEHELIRLLLLYPESIAMIRSTITIEQFSYPELQSLAEAIYQRHDRGESIEISKLLQVFSDEKMHKLISKLSFGKKEEYEGKVQKIAIDCMNRINAQHIATERKKIERKLQEAEYKGDSHTIRGLLQKWWALKNRENKVYRSGEGEKFHG